jgi:hypothetical protein
MTTFLKLLAIFLICWACGALYHYVDTLTPTAHADEKVLSDRQQEKEYCTEWLTGEKGATGGMVQEIRNHCAKYLN